MCLVPEKSLVLLFASDCCALLCCLSVVDIKLILRLLSVDRLDV